MSEDTDAAERIFRELHGLDIADSTDRAEHIMVTVLDGITVGPFNRRGVIEELRLHFEHFADLLASQSLELDNVSKELDSQNYNCGKLLNENKVLRQRIAKAQLIIRAAHDLAEVLPTTKVVLETYYAREHLNKLRAALAASEQDEREGKG